MNTTSSPLPTRALGIGLCLLALAFLGNACASSDAPPAATPDAAFDEAKALVDAAEIEQDIRVLSADEMEGRGPGGAGDAMARKYIAERMAEMGIQPGAADGSWEQVFDLVGVEADVPATWTFTKSGVSEVLADWDDFIAASGVQTETSTIDGAELLFVGYGIEAPEYGWDDFKGMDVTGKVLVMLNNDPEWSPDLFEGERRLFYGRWTYKYEQGAKHGAAGVIIIHTTPSAGYPWSAPTQPATRASRAQPATWAVCAWPQHQRHRPGGHCRGFSGGGGGRNRRAAEATTPGSDQHHPAQHPRRRRRRWRCESARSPTRRAVRGPSRRRQCHSRPLASRVGALGPRVSL